MKSDVRMRIEQCLVDTVLKNAEPTHIVTAVKLPTGAVEIAINTANVVDKLHYIAQAYDDEMRLKTNPIIQMIDVMVVFP